MKVCELKSTHWGDHLLQDLNKIWEKYAHCDIKLLFKNNSELKVHRCMLSACTDYFELLIGQTRVQNPNCIELVMPDNMQDDVIKPIVKFIYNGKLTFPMDIEDKIYQTSMILKIPMLTKLLKNHRNYSSSTISRSAIRSLSDGTDNKSIVIAKHQSQSLPSTQPRSLDTADSTLYLPKTEPMNKRDVSADINNCPIIKDTAKVAQMPKRLNRTNIGLIQKKTTKECSSIKIIDDVILKKGDCNKKIDQSRSQPKNTARGVTIDKLIDSKKNEIFDGKMIIPSSKQNKHSHQNTDNGYTYKTIPFDLKEVKKLVALGAENIKGPWICLTCGTPGRAMHFKTYYNFRLHLVEVHHNKPISTICEYCGIKSPKRHYLLYHLYTQHGVTPPRTHKFPKCNLCDYIGLHEGFLHKHMLSYHKKHRQNHCLVCSASFDTLEQLNKHKNDNGHMFNKELNAYECVFCEKTFVREKNMYTHLKLVHKQEWESERRSHTATMKNNNEKQSSTPSPMTINDEQDCEFDAWMEKISKETSEIQRANNTSDIPTSSTNDEEIITVDDDNNDSEAIIYVIEIAENKDKLQNKQSHNIHDNITE